MAKPASKAKLRKIGDALHAACLDWCRARYESGHPDGVLNAVDFCLRSGRRVPLWAAQAFCDSFLDWADGRARTLDEAFRLVTPDQRTFRARREHNRLRPLVVYRVLRASIVHRKPIGDVTFAEIARELHTSERTVSRVYYEPESKPFIAIVTKALAVDNYRPKKM